MVKHFEDNMGNLLTEQKISNTPAPSVESNSSKKENEDFDAESSPQKKLIPRSFSTEERRPSLVKIKRSKIKKKGNTKWNTDPDLPLGWKWKTYKTDPDRERRMLLSPEQKRYLSIFSALRQMNLVDDKKEEVAILIRFLTKDGWFSTELLPPGYRLKQKRSERSFLSLTPAFNQLRTMRELFDNLRHEGYSQETVAKIKNNYR